MKQVAFCSLVIVVFAAAQNLAPTCVFGQQSGKAPSTSNKPAKASPPKPGTTRMEKLPLPEVVTRLSPNPPFKVAKIDRSRRADIQSAASQIDALIDRKLEQNNEKPQPALRDEQFVRRVYLELAGRIPTYDEAKKFLDSKSESIRTQLIDDLLESPDYVSHNYN